MRRNTIRQKASAEKVVKDIRRATRRHYGAEEKIRIVLEGLRGEDSIAELCRREGINQNLSLRKRGTYWRSDARSSSQGPWSMAGRKSLWPSSNLKPSYRRGRTRSEIFTAATYSGQILTLELIDEQKCVCTLLK